MSKAPQVEAVFFAALERESADERAAYLESACAGDPELRRLVERLLNAHPKVGDFLKKPVVDQLAPAERPDATQELGPSTDGDCIAPVRREPTRTEAESSAEEEDGSLRFLSPSTRPDSLGRIGHYEVLEVLGKGGFGIVFRAFDEVLQRVVALKVLAPMIAATSPARKRFLREARSSAQVRHENVVQVYAVEEQPLPYLVMEFIPGESLQQRLDRIGPLEVPDIVRIGRQIAEGLAAAHATGLIHRDIKPGNVLIEKGAQERVKITDFGLARAADDASLTQSGLLSGTPMYMAPEQAKGESLDHRADLFSLGSVLYVMAAGRPPFRAATAFAVLKRVVEEEPRAIQDVIPEVPKWLCDIIAKLQAKKPEDRFATAQEVADLLARCQTDMHIPGNTPNVLPKSAAPEKSPVSQEITKRSLTMQQPRSGSRKSVAAVAIVLLPVLALAVTEFAGVTHLFRDQHTPSHPLKSGIEPIEKQKSPIQVPSGAPSPEVKTLVPAPKQQPLPPTFKNSLGMEFVIVPKGRSWLGGGKDMVGDKEVEIPADFYLGKYEVTQEEWEQVMGENPSYFSRTGPGMNVVKEIPDADLKRFPVEKVTWHQCQIFVEKLNRLEKATGWVYRLPKEVEWEYACRGGPMSDKLDSAFDFYFARPTNTLLLEQANFGKGLKGTCKVGSYEPNVLGLYDMHGNVWEWCDDLVKPAKGDSHAVQRGGDWNNPGGKKCRAAHSWTHPPSDRFNGQGLRLARVPSGIPSPETKTPPLGVAAFTAADVKRIADLPADQQVEEVRKELKRRNPDFDGALTPRIENDVVTEIAFSTDQVSDISPVRALTKLNSLSCFASDVGRGQLGARALLPLRGLPLTKLNCRDSPALSDLSPLKEMELTSLDCRHTNVGDADVKNLAGLKNLQLLVLWGAKVTDAGLKELAGMKTLQHLSLQNTGITDVGLKELSGLDRLAYLDLYAVRQVTDEGLKELAALKGLKNLDLRGTSVTDEGAEKLASVRPSLRIVAPRGRVIEPKVGFAPFTDADVKRIAALPAAEQIEEVRAELKKRNPDFQGSIAHTLAENRVHTMTIDGPGMQDISPVRALPELQVFGLIRANMTVTDLAPLRGMVLTRLDLFHTGVSDLSPLQGMKTLRNLDLSASKKVTDLSPLHGIPLKLLTIHGTGISDLTPLKDMRLELLNCNGSKVSDLSPLKGMPLTLLTLKGTAVTDLAPLKDLPLKVLGCDYQAARDAKILRAIKTLETINGKPAAEVLKEPN